MKKLQDHHGREVATITWPDGSIQSEKDGMKMFYSWEYHGDHALEWVIVENAEGEETVRHNAAMLESIVWKP
jgi:hypothetical protein